MAFYYDQEKCHTHCVRCWILDIDLNIKVADGTRTDACDEGDLERVIVVDPFGVFRECKAKPDDIILGNIRGAGDLTGPCADPGVATEFYLTK